MPFTDKCLGPGGVGIFDSQGKLTPAARDAFTAQVITLLTSGNENGKGAKISSLLGIPFPPPSGIKLFDPDKALITPDDPNGDLFWFAPSPFAPLTFDALRDPEGGYQKQIVDTLYGSLMGAMNQNGNAAVLPVADYSGIFPPDISARLKMPDIPIVAALLFPTPQLPALAKKLKLELPDVGDLVTSLGNIVPIPSLPSLPGPPSIPPFMDFIVFFDLFKELIMLPIKLIPKLIADFAVPTKALDLLAPDPAGLFNLVLGLTFGLVIEILKAVGLLAILPKLLSATIIVTLQNAVIGMVILLVSQIIGTGVIVKFLGEALGLA